VDATTDVLDGLDEVPDAMHRREQVKKAVQEFDAQTNQ
jgi:hypothetical protein